MSARAAALPAAAATGVLVGVALVLTRSVVDEAGPITVAFLRYLLGLLFMLPLLARSGLPTFRRRDLLPVTLLGIGQFGILIALLNYSLTLIDAGQAALIFAVFPLITMALAVAMGQEPFTLRRAVGIAMTIAGVGLAIGGAAFAGAFSSDQWWGVAAALASAFTGALCSVLYRPYLQRYPTVQVSTLAMFAAAIFLAVLAVPEGLLQDLPHISTDGWLAIVGIGLCSGVGYLLWLFALQHVWASNVTAFMGLSPLAASLLGALFLTEPLTAADGAALALVLSGLALALWRSG